MSWQSLTYSKLLLLLPPLAPKRISDFLMECQTSLPLLSDPPPTKHYLPRFHPSFSSSEDQGSWTITCSSHRPSPPPPILLPLIINLSTLALRLALFSHPVSPQVSLMQAAASSQAQIPADCLSVQTISTLSKG